MRRALSIGVTTRNRPEALRACLSSMRVIAHLDPEILIFDDHSAPPALTQVSETGVAARVIRDDAAPGYIVGRNRLVAEAEGECVLLLDDDTRLIEAGAVEAALELLCADARVAAVAFAQAEENGDPWPAAMQPSTAQVPTVVPSFIGFAHMVRRATFLAMGGYRESFEFYGEEKDFCLRLLDAGYQTVYLPDARVAHVTDGASRDRRRYLRFVARNDCLNSLYNDPLSRLIWMLPARYGLYFRMRRGWKIPDPWGGFWLAREVLSRLPQIWRERRPVSRRTMRHWSALRKTQPHYAVPPLQPDAARGR